jgi:hypothetical protein
MPAWNDVKDEFVWEGSWRDICVLDTTISDWRSVWLTLTAPDVRAAFKIDDVEAALPEDVDRVFARRNESSVILSVVVSGVQLNCHFFGEFEIEFDLDPREVTGQADFDAVVAFMRKLAAATGKVAFMTPENTHDAPFLRVAPTGAAEYSSSDGFFRELAEQHQ